jgi:outer membrane cobalamin receptor
MTFCRLNVLSYLCWLIVFLPFSLYSQTVHKTVQINEVSVKGKKLFNKEEAGMKTTKVDSMVLLDKINVSLSDVLSQNTTVFIKDHGRGALATASFRGTAPSHTQVYWNGLSINSPMLGMTDFSLIPSFIIDDIELEHGSASLSSGSGGLGGSIVIQNLPGWDNRLSWRYYQGIGSYSTFDQFFQLNAGTRKFQSKSRLYYTYSKNDYEYVNKSIMEQPLVKNENAAYSKKGVVQEFYFRPGMKDVVSLKAWGQIADRSLPSVMSYEGNDQSNLNNQLDSMLTIVADWNNYGGKIKLSARSGIDYKQTNYQLRNYISGVGMIPAINSSSNAFSWYNHLGLESEKDKQLEWKTNVDFIHYNVHTHESVKKTGYDKIRNDLSFFGGMYYQATKWLNMSFTLRDDNIAGRFSPLMYTVGASISPFDGNKLLFKTNFSRNFHNPSLNDLYWQPGGNPNLLPEESYTGEFSVEYYIDKEDFKLEQVITPYYSDIDNWIIWLPSFQGYWQPFNLKKVKSYGVEYHIKIVRKIGNVDLEVYGNYALTKSLNFGEKLFLGDGSFGKQLPFIPVHSGNVLFSAIWKGYYLRFQNTSYSARYTLNSNDIGLSDDSEEIGSSVSTSRMNWYYPYFMNNLTMGKDFKLKKYLLGIDFKINNLFNEKYRSVLGRYMPGRNYELMIKISYKK